MVVFEIDAWRGDVRIADPDRRILDTAFIPLSEAFAVIEALPWPHMREPLVAYLTGTALPGSLSLYRQHGSTETLVAHIPLKRSDTQQSAEGLKG